jgi:hypothetical protein
MNRSRLVLGWILFGLSLAPWVMAPAVPLLGLDAARSAALVGGLLLGAEVIGVLAVAVLGREAVGALRARWRRRRKEESRCPN